MPVRKLERGDWIVFLTIIVVVSASLFSLWWFVIKIEPSKVRSVQTGDRLNVDYRGWLENGEYFDTSEWEVASNNISYPKATSFNLRPKDQYKPFDLTVGKGVIAGWSEGVVGMTLGEVRQLIIPPAKAYGFPDPAKIEVRQLVESLPMVIELNDTEFATNYSGTPGVGAIVLDQRYGWPVRILSLENGLVTAVVIAEMNDVYQTKWPWKLKILDVDSNAAGGKGEVRLRHLLTAADANRVSATDSGKIFFITKVDEAAGTFDFDRNDFLAGKTLVFRIKLLKFM